MLSQKIGREGLGLLFRTIIPDDSHYHMGLDAVCLGAYTQTLALDRLLSGWEPNRAQRISFLYNVYFAIRDREEDSVIDHREVFGETDEKAEELVQGSFDGWCCRFKAQTDRLASENNRPKEILDRLKGDAGLIEEENYRHRREIVRHRKVFELGPNV